MFNWDVFARFNYLEMEAAIIGSALIFVVGFHFPILWQHRRALALTTGLVTIYGSALDAWSIANRWGWFTPALTSGLWFGSLLLEELIFWIGTAFVTAAAALVMAEAVDHRIPWWALPVALIFPSWIWLTTTENIFAGVRT